MCGIVGFITPRPGVGYMGRTAFVSQGLVVNSLRGSGGTGMALVRGPGDIEVHKRALSGADFVNSQVAEIGFRNFDNVRVCIGHNRAATIGSIKDKNCHPFYYNDRNEIALVHNGTLNNYLGMSPVGFNHDVDSAHAAKALAEGEDTQKILKDVNGPFVFVWWNGTNHTFNIARNEFRDIYYTYDKEGGMYFASEYKMLDWLLERNNIDRGKGGYLYPHDHNWLSWQFDDKGGFTNKPKSVDITPEKKPFSYPQKFFPPMGSSESRRNFRRGGRADLETVGLKAGELIIVEILAFESYAPSDRQTLHGKIICTPKFSNVVEEVWIHNKSRQEYETLRETFADHLPVRVINAITSWSTQSSNDEQDVVLLAEIREIDTQNISKLREADAKAVDAVDKKRLIKQAVEDALDSDDGLAQVELFLGPRNSWLTAKELADLINRGCAFCNVKPSKEDYAAITWLPDYAQGIDFLCSECANLDEAREIVGLEKLPPIVKAAEG